MRSRRFAASDEGREIARLQLYGYPLIEGTQADLTALQREFLLLALPDPMATPRGRGTPASGKPRKPQGISDQFRQKIEARKRAQMGRQ